MLDPRPRNMELAFLRSEECEGGVESSLRFSVTSSVVELFDLRSTAGGGLSVPGMCKSGFKRWAICLMNFMVATGFPSLFNVPLSLPCLAICCVPQDL